MFLALIPTTLFAQAGTSATPPAGQVFSSMLPMFAMVFIIFYFLVFKPQQKKLKDQQALITSLKKGESVVTSSGIIGRVASVEENHVTIEIATNVKVKVEKAHIVKREEKGAAEKSAA